MGKLFKLLIISPHFPPFNGADMHRIRQSLPYYEFYGWQPTVITVEPKYIEGEKDDLLLSTIPSNIRIINVKALSVKFTRKFGLGSLALRSIYFYWKEVNKILEKENFDLIYFSTTQFPLLILGNFWKKRFKIPYIIDMQDPWFTDYYLSKPKNERPPKFWFAYRLNKYLEPIAMKSVDGIIAVSEVYHQELRNRYLNINPKNCHTITFGAFEKDFEVIDKHKIGNPFFHKDSTDIINIVYVGVVGDVMKSTIYSLLKGIQIGLEETPNLFSKIKLSFIGTSYAPKGKGRPSVYPIAKELGLSKYVFEQTDRVPYFQALTIIKEADILLLLGSDNPSYSASKVFPYVLAKKPLLAIFHSQSSVVNFLQKTKAGFLIAFSEGIKEEVLRREIYLKLYMLLNKIPFLPDTDWEEFHPYTARAKTEHQIKVFNQIISQ